MITSKDGQGQITVGLDVGDKNIHACFLDQDGAVVEESRLGATPALCAGASRARNAIGSSLKLVFTPPG